MSVKALRAVADGEILITKGKDARLTEEAERCEREKCTKSGAQDAAVPTGAYEARSFASRETVHTQTVGPGTALPAFANCSPGPNQPLNPALLTL